MSELKRLKAVFKCFKNKHRPLLSDIKCNLNSLYITDLETTIQIKDNFGLNEGVHSVETIDLINDGVINHEYPLLDFTSNCPKYSFIDTNHIKDLIRYASKDETRLYLNSVAISDGQLVATNGHILKTYKLSCKHDETYLMPVTSLKILLKLCNAYKLKGVLKVALDGVNMIIDNSQFTFKARLIEREYVKWQNVIPSKYSKSFNVTDWPKVSTIKPLFDKRTMSGVIESVDGIVTLRPKDNHNTKYQIGTSDHDFILGVNIKYADILANKNKQFSVQYNNECSPLNFNGAILMPLKL